MFRTQEYNILWSQARFQRPSTVLFRKRSGDNFMVTTDSRTTHTCNSCYKEKPLADFRRRRRGGDERHWQCRECYNESMRQFRASRRTCQLNGFTRQVVESPRDPLAGLCRSMIRQFGGLDAFAAAWMQHINSCAARQPGGRNVLRSMLAVARLIELSEEQSRPLPSQSDRPAAEDLCDEELARELDHILRAGTSSTPA